MLDMRVTGQYHAASDVTERYRNIGLRGWQGNSRGNSLNLHAEHKVRRLFAVSGNSSGWRFDSPAALRFLLFLILLVLPGSVFLLPLWWWLNRHKARLAQGAR